MAAPRKDSTQVARHVRSPLREREVGGELAAAKSVRTRKQRSTKDPIYANNFVLRAKDKAVEICSDKRNPGLVWRKMQSVGQHVVARPAAGNRWSRG